MHALIVDDSRAMRSILRNALSTAGFQTTEAGHGREALEKLENMQMPQIAFVDWNMPEMNGYDFLRAVRNNPKYDSMLVMMVTTETEMERMRMALEAGANEYIMKPFSQESFLGKLQILGFEV